MKAHQSIALVKDIKSIFKEVESEVLALGVSNLKSNLLCKIFSYVHSKVVIE